MRKQKRATNYKTFVSELCDQQHRSRYRHNSDSDSDSEIVYLTFICQVTVHHTNKCIQCQETPIKTISCR